MFKLPTGRGLKSVGTKKAQEPHPLVTFMSCATWERTVGDASRLFRTASTIGRIRTLRSQPEAQVPLSTPFRVVVCVVDSLTISLRSVPKLPAHPNNKHHGFPNPPTPQIRSRWYGNAGRFDKWFYSSLSFVGQRLPCLAQPYLSKGKNKQDLHLRCPRITRNVLWMFFS